MTPKGVRASAAFLLLAALLLLPARVAAQGVGFFQRPTPTTITSPVTGATVVWDTTTRQWKVWNGGEYATVTQVNAASYGVVCDNATDNSTALDNAAAAAAGGVLILPQSTATCNYATTFKPRPKTTIIGGAPPSGARGVAPPNGLKYTGTGSAIWFDGATYGANQPWFTTLRETAVFCSAACTEVIKTSGGARNITLEHNLFWGNANTGGTTAVLYFTGDGTLNGSPQGIRVIRNYIDQGKVWSILFDAGGTINEIAENDISGPFGGVLSISSTTVNMLGFTWRDNAITAPQQAGPTISVTSMSGGKFHGGYMECGPSGATRCFAFAAGGLGTVGIEIGGGMFIQPDSVSLAVVEGAQISSSFKFGPVSVSAAVTNCVLATNPGTIAWYTIIGNSNCTNTFRNGTAGTQYTSHVVTDSLQAAGNLIVDGSITPNNGIWTINAGFQAGTPTGGDKGTGTVNASAYYVHGTAIASMPLTNASGTITNAPHLVQDTVTLTGGTAGVALAGAAAFTSATTYTCVCDNDSAVLACRVVQNGGNGFTVSSGAGTDVVRFLCAGN